MNDLLKELLGGALGRCAARVTACPTARTVHEAWKLLPPAGEGWVALADAVDRYDPLRRDGWLQQAEVADGARTVVLRQDGEMWRAWVWEEATGDEHRRVERLYVSSAGARHGRVPRMRYFTYWRRVDRDGVGVWEPFGSRFAGWVD